MCAIGSCKGERVRESEMLFNARTMDHDSQLEENDSGANISSSTE
jgi:hypothetical protein